MIGPALMERLAALPYACPVIAGAGLSAATFAAIDWTRATGQATGALALVGLVGGSVVGGIVYAINRYDHVKLARQKLYEDANKDSLSNQIEQLTRQAADANAANLANQEKMRESLHQLRSDANKTHLENHDLREDLSTLRTQFMAVSKQLHETDLLLHAARAEMHAMTLELKRASASELAAVKDRDALQAKLDTILSSQVDQGQRIATLEKGSGPHDFPAPTEAPR